MTADWFHLGADTWRYLSMPVISAMVGYVTNVVAIRMMFHPVEFMGVARPWLGWQGIVPRKASKMTGIAVDTITESLITESRDIRPARSGRVVATEIEGPLLVMVDDVIKTVMRRHIRSLWQAMPRGAAPRDPLSLAPGRAAGGDAGDERDTQPIFAICSISRA